MTKSGRPTGSVPNLRSSCAAISTVGIWATRPLRHRLGLEHRIDDLANWGCDEAFRIGAEPENPSRALATVSVRNWSGIASANSRPHSISQSQSYASLCGTWARTVPVHFLDPAFEPRVYSALRRNAMGGWRARMARNRFPLRRALNAIVEGHGARSENRGFISRRQKVDLGQPAHMQPSLRAPSPS